MSRLPRVYLAGKIAPTDWRHTIFTNLRSVDAYRYGDEAPAWPSVRNLGSPDAEYRDGFHYAGPYFLACDHSCAHGDNNHGLGADDGGCIPSTPRQERVVAWCLKWLRESDVVFCWLDAEDAYGTIAELGYAHALGRPIFLAWPSDRLPPPSWWTDTWFVREMASALCPAPDALAAWGSFVEWWAGRDWTGQPVRRLWFVEERP